MYTMNAAFDFHSLTMKLTRYFCRNIANRLCPLSFAFSHLPLKLFLMLATFELKDAHALLV